MIDTDTDTGSAADVSFRRLSEGNARFVNLAAAHPNTCLKDLTEITSGQSPCATIVTCSDSRVPVSRVFDCGVGDLFVIRVIGGTCTPGALASVEYGVGVLGTPLLVVMGHSCCGAVAAATSNETPPGMIGHVVSHIRPSVDVVRATASDLDSEAFLSASIIEHARQSARSFVQSSTIVGSALRAGAVRVIPAMYDIASGRVTWHDSISFTDEGTAPAAAA